MRCKCLSASLVLALAVAAAAAAGDQVVPTVRIGSMTSVRGPAITLGDIGDVEGADAAMASALEALHLGVSPMPGSWRELERELILSQLVRNGFGPRRVRLVCPKTVRIYRESMTVSQEALEDRLRDYIAANSPWGPGEAQIKSISRIGDVVVPAGELTISVFPRGNVNYLGPVPFVVELAVDGRKVSSMTMQADIGVFRDAVVTTTPIPAHQVIGPADVELRRIDISSARGKAFSSVDEVIGMATTTYLQAGSVVTARNLNKPILVRRGDAVSLIASRPGFIIKTTGIAQGDGRLGEVIKVLNPVSRKVIEAEVVGARRAKVLF